jgi:hypothetical protein
MLADNGLSVITVKKTELLKALKKNMLTHRDEFLKAQVGYRKAVIQELDSMIQDAKANREIRTIIRLEAPSDHSSDYTRIIKMLEMNVKHTIQITEQQFSQYVLDDWAWKRAFVNTSNMYNGNG